ncbi:hypothetical protein ACFPRL_01525 [Pseudoclavibacter helvolus]
MSRVTLATRCRWPMSSWICSQSSSRTGHANWPAITSSQGVPLVFSSPVHL